jgi:NAD(P) transhydrogenase subunit alpha
LSPTAADIEHLNDLTAKFIDNRQSRPGPLNNIRSVAMKIGAPTETAEGEARVALTPESAERLRKLGYECLVESGAGAAASITDAAYEAAGVKVLGSANELWGEADVIVKVREPSLAEVDAAPEGKTLISFIWPAANEDLLAKLQAKQMSVLAMDMVPRISRAQKMDALSSYGQYRGLPRGSRSRQQFRQILYGPNDGGR